jgi:hypothetical protein
MAERKTDDIVQRGKAECSQWVFVEIDVRKVVNDIINSIFDEGS